MPEVVFLIFLIGIFLIATPIIVVVLLVKHSSLRSEFNLLKEENARQHASFQHEVADLKRQLTAAAHSAALLAGEPVQRPVTTATPPPKETPATAPRVESPMPVKLPAPMSFPPTEKKPEPPLQTPQKPPAIEPKPVLPVAAKTPVEVKPFSPVSPSQTTPPLISSSQPPAPRIPVPTPRATAEIPPGVAARVSAPPPIAAYRAPAPKPTLQQRMKTVSAIEETLGTNWLNKLGIIILVVGVALFGIYELGALGPLGKVGISYLASAFLLVGGIFLEKNERYRLLGRTGIGGGLALFFFSAYAIYHVAAMHVLDSLTLDCILMLVVAIAMAAHTLRYRSQFVTGLAFLLGYTTVALSQDTVYSLSAGVALAIGLVCIVLKMSWFEVEVFGILSSYLNHLYWLYRILGIEGAHGRHFQEYHASLLLLFFYWLTFRISYIARNIKTDFEEHISTLAALLNVLLLLAVMKFQSVQPELAYLALLVVGAFEFTLAQLPITKRRHQAFVVLSVVGATLMLAAVPFHYSGNNVAILWLVGAEAFLAAGIIAKEVVFRRLGLLTGLLVGLHLIGVDFRQLLNQRLANEDLALAAGVLFSLCAVVFYINALGAGSRWKELFPGSPDRPLLTIHSYLGGFAAACAAWALFSHDWTALAFAAVMLIVAILGRALKLQHLQVQYALVGALTLYRGIIVNLHLESPEHAHIRLRLLTLPILSAAFYLTAKLSSLRDDPEQRTLRGLFAAAGSSFLGLLIWYEVPELWQPLAFIAFAVILSEAARALRYYALAWHSHLLTGLAVFTALTPDQSGVPLWHTIPVRAFSALPVVVGGYWLAKRLGTTDDRHVVLARSIRWIRYTQLAWQANVVGLCALLRAYFYNYNLEQKFWGPISLRIFTIAVVAAGLYLLSRKATPEERYARVIAFLHSFAATGLLALLAWYEYPNGWLAPLWAAFALVLAIVDQRFELEELPWQSHILAGLTLLRSVSVNLYVTATWHGISVRLLSLAIVAVLFYALSRLIRMSEKWRQRDIYHIYSWAASAIGGLLLWYELQTRPAGIAVAWGAFGLVLFEYGLLRKITQFRYQAYVALVAAFTRIFYSNLTASDPGEFWGPRMYTILPLALIFFFVYAQLPEKEEDTGRDRRLHLDALLAYLGTATIVALFYFQFPIEWVVTSWAAVVFALLGAALPPSGFASDGRSSRPRHGA